MFIRLGLLLLLSFLSIACVQESKVVEGGGECLDVLGVEPDSNFNFGYVVIIREQSDISRVQSHFESKYSGLFSVYDNMNNGFKANIDSDAALEELKCDNRVTVIEYDSEPTG